MREVHQFRKRGAADWYDGKPDDEDGGGPYEQRTLYEHTPMDAANLEWVYVRYDVYSAMRDRASDIYKDGYDVGKMHAGQTAPADDTGQQTCQSCKGTGEIVIDTDEAVDECPDCNGEAKAVAYTGQVVALGSAVTNIAASDENPIKHGWFIRRGKRSGRMNAGAFIEYVTADGRLHQTPPENIAPRKAEPAFRSTHPAPLDAERVREDERDRLFADACKPVSEGGPGAFMDIASWIKRQGAMLPADRAALRQKEGKA